MAGQRAPLLLLLVGLLPGLLLSEAAKIFTMTSLGGSHYLLMSQVSQVLQDHGHNVTMFYKKDDLYMSGFKEEEKSYNVITWFSPEDCDIEFKESAEFFIREGLEGRDSFENIIKIWKSLGLQCNHLLRNGIMDSLKSENFDLLVIEGFDFCGLLVAEKLGKPFVTTLPTTFGTLEFGLPSPISYVPVFHSLLTDHMDFWSRVKNFMTFIDFFMQQWRLHSVFDDIIKEHFQEGSRPVLSHLLKKAELWFVNSDFAFEFARPLFPNTVYIGGLMAKPSKPVPHEFETFIAKFGDSGFVLVVLGSVVDMFQSQEVLKEMNSAFARLPHGVIWKYDSSRWPKDIKLSANVKMVDWLPQKDLLAHPHIRLFITHGGINSIMEAIRHGVPIVGLAILGDQPGNMVRVEAKKFGVSIRFQQVKAETLALTAKQVIEDKSTFKLSSVARHLKVEIQLPEDSSECLFFSTVIPGCSKGPVTKYKSAAVAASIIMRSQPLTPTQRLVGWIDHVLQTGGAAHLKPRALQQPWYEQYLLDVFLFLLVVTLGSLWLCWKLLGMVVRWLCGSRKQKKA